MNKNNQHRRDESRVPDLKQAVLSISALCFLAACTPMKFEPANLVGTGPSKAGTPAPCTTPTPGPTPWPDADPTPTPKPCATPTPTPTPVPPTPTPVPPTPTPVPPTPTPVPPTPTPVPPTPTPVPPTPTPKPPTPTPVPPTPTPTPTPKPPTPTPTPVPPTPTPVPRAYEHFNQDKNAGKVDILIINDNSSSMDEEQRKMSERFGSFVSALKDLDYQIAMTLSDVDLKKTGAQTGPIVTWTGTNTKILTPKT
ncbi:MAG TPA: hypothetical protein VM432_05695, partial [Bdellovibrionales bacterium]|nr:hypothetical protein [Bdellovibrionales bacterium]